MLESLIALLMACIGAGIFNTRNTHIYISSRNVLVFRERCLSEIFSSHHKILIFDIAGVGHVITEHQDHRPRCLNTGSGNGSFMLGNVANRTMSLVTALDKLGYKSYHMKECAPTPGACEKWNYGLRAKYYNEGKPYERVEFDKLLGKYNVLTDIPCIMFVDELLAAYPNAKVLLTNRDPDKWLASISKTFYVILSWKWEYLFPYDSTKILPHYISELRMIMDIWTGNDWLNKAKLRQMYINHYAHVRAVVPKENLLEFRSQDGWEPLCRFLGKPVPEEPYPHINDGEWFVTQHKYWWYFLIVGTLVKNSWKVLVPGAAWFAWLVYQNKLCCYPDQLMKIRVLAMPDQRRFGHKMDSCHRRVNSIFDIMVNLHPYWTSHPYQSQPGGFEVGGFS